LAGGVRRRQGPETHSQGAVAGPPGPEQGLGSGLLAPGRGPPAARRPPIAWLFWSALASPAGPAFVVEHGVQPLGPPRAVVGQGLAKPRLRPQLLDLLGRDPGLGQILLAQKQN